MNISKGPVKTAIRVGIYGTEGVGKTTFASRFPGAVFIDTEGSTVHMDVARFDRPESLGDVMDQLSYVAGAPEGIRTVVIDTVDWLEKLIFRAVCEEKSTPAATYKNIEDFGYGKGYAYAKQKMQEILEILDVIISRGINVVLVCHSMIRKFEQPDEMGSYDRYMLKLNERNIAPLVKEWVDLLLFVNYRTNVVTDEKTKTKKATGGKKRVMYTTHSACWDAKNRFGLPDELPFEFEQIAHLFSAQPAEVKQEAEPAVEVTTVDTVPETPKKGKKKPDPDTTRPESMKSDDPEKDKLLDQLWSNMLVHQIYDPLIVQAVVAEKDYYDISVPIRDYDRDFIEGCLIEAWDKVMRLCLRKIHDLPF